MITIKIHDIDSDNFESAIKITGSSKEIIKDFYALFDAIEKDDKGIKILYKLAEHYYRNKRGNNEDKN